MAKTLDVDYVRARFPAFSEPSLDGHAFFENAGGSYACAPVVERLNRFYRERKVQPYGPFPASAAGGAEMDEARTRLSALMGVPPDALHFGPSTTQNSYVLAQAFRQMLSPGDAIIVTNQDHEANTGPWRRLADSGIQVREWRLDPETGHLSLDGLDALLDEAVKLVAVTHCSNVVAEINPIPEIAAKVHDAGAFLCVDGVSYAPHGLPNLGALGADIYLFSAYKTYGPHQGIMMVRPELTDKLPNQGHYFNAGSRTSRLTPAGPDHAQIAASAGMADYIDDLAGHLGQGDANPVERGEAVHNAMRWREIELMMPLLEYLSSRNDVRLIGPRDAEKRAPTIAVDLGRLAEPVAEELATHNIGVGGGDFYAVRALEGLGIDPAQGVLRMSFVHYTTAEEVDRLINALDRVL